MSSVSGSSETFANQPVNGAGEGSGGAKRTMADITRLFMNGAKPVENGRPQRLSPQARAAQAAAEGGAVANGSRLTSVPPAKPVIPVLSAVPTVATVPTIHATPAASPQGAVIAGCSANGGLKPGHDARNRRARATQSAGLRAKIAPSSQRVFPAVQVALLEVGGSMELVLDAARRVAAARKCTVGVIASDRDSLGIWRIEGRAWDEPGAEATAGVGGGGVGRFTPTAFHAPQAPVDVQVARALFALRGGVDSWIVALPNLAESPACQLLEAAKDWLAVCGTDNDALIGCYRAASRPPVGPRITAKNAPSNCSCARWTARRRHACMAGSTTWPAIF